MASNDERGTRQERVLPVTWADSHRFVPRAFVQPVLSFMRAEASGGILMLAAAVIALVWANSPFGDSYFALMESRIEIVFGDFRFHHLSELTVREWVNDALMVVFFFVVGLEIKRELVIGELNDRRSATLPAIAAVGGMVVPALLYAAFNAGTEGARGWGVPMATDIAFAVGIVSLVGRRVPVAAKLFLLALAIVDDLGAILVIAIFYTDDLSFAWLLAAGVGLAVVYAMRRVSIRAVPAYLIVGVFVWLAVLESGVHATVAGVALALLTPVASYYSPAKFAPRARALVDRVESYLPEDQPPGGPSYDTIERVQSLLLDVRRLARETVPPLSRLEHALERWSSFVVIPVFALANAGVRLGGDALTAAVSDTVAIGVALGLVVGKTLGVAGGAWLALKSGLGRMPAKTTWHHMIGMGLLAGIGFTVALFVAALAFEPGSDLGDAAKIGIFAGSLVAGVAGFVWLRFLGPDPEELDRDHDGVLDSRRSQRAAT